MLVDLYATILLYSHQAESGLHFDIKFIWVHHMYVSNQGQKRKKFQHPFSLIFDIFNFFKAKSTQHIFFSFDPSSPASEAKIKKKFGQK